jgi:ArsR family transcriptional regulator
LPHPSGWLAGWRDRWIRQWVFYQRDEERIAQAKETLSSDW